MFKRYLDDASFMTRSDPKASKTITARNRRDGTFQSVGLKRQKSKLISSLELVPIEQKKGQSEVKNKVVA
jgi:hypothetical protein